MIFEKATRMKLRFPAGKGDISTEDLWDLPLTSKNGCNLDDVANTIFKGIKDTGVSFVKTVSRGDSTLNLKLNVVKAVIAYKLEAREAAERSVEKKAKQQQLLALIGEKQHDAMKGKSIEQLQKELNEL